MSFERVWEGRRCIKVVRCPRNRMVTLRAGMSAPTVVRSSAVRRSKIFVCVKRLNVKSQVVRLLVRPSKFSGMRRCVVERVVLTFRRIVMPLSSASSSLGLAAWSLESEDEGCTFLGNALPPVLQHDVKCRKTDISASRLQEPCPLQSTAVSVLTAKPIQL